MRKISNWAAAFICIVILAGCDGLAQRGALQFAYTDIKTGKYESALKNLSDAESYKKPTPELEAEMLYLKAVCYSGMGRHEEAIGLLVYIIDKFPDSSYAYQAKAKLVIKPLQPEEQEHSAESQEPAMKEQEPPVESQEPPVEEEQEPVFEHPLI